MNRRERRSLRAQDKWVPLEPATVKPKTEAEIGHLVEHALQLAPDMDRKAVREMILDSLTNETWMNDRYVVTVIRMYGPGGLPIVQLSIRRQDRGVARDWRDFQRIKNQLVGPECEGVELYPAESRLVDTATQWHIWCVSDSRFRFPFGFETRLVTGESGGGGTVQRSFEEEAP
jgi:hypothetical protein